MKKMPQKRVVYLLGAGATQGCLSFAGSTVRLLMRDLNSMLLERLREDVAETYRDNHRLQELVNDVLDEDTDYEHILTFLEQSPSADHRALSEKARAIFRSVLSNEMERAIHLRGGSVPNDLYLALLDLHAIEGFPERLAGFITVNYDGFLEAAVGTAGRYRIEWGVALDDGRRYESEREPLPLVKLHGSFEWLDSFPVQGRALGDESHPLWIPPGVIKEKERYPFNALWGRAREVLNCEILRIVGLNLGPNDWDLISLLFSTRHGNDVQPPYTVELIGSPQTAERLKTEFPYLDVRSILETERAGEELVGEYLNRAPVVFEKLNPDEQRRVIEVAGKGRNWFLDWLKRNLEWAHVNLEIAPELVGARKVLEDVI